MTRIDGNEEMKGEKPPKQRGSNAMELLNRPFKMRVVGMSPESKV